ncbi:MAG TPA: Rv3235 family protein [Streptosporangiaceae bacterium]|nr:Rv3235 family protein [Streptosporangiaceae bacterium]
MPELPPDLPGAPPPPPEQMTPGRRRCPRPAVVPKPLPDPDGVLLCRIPDSAPPYDTDQADGTGGELPGARGTSRSPAGPGTPSRSGPPGVPGPLPVPSRPGTPGWPSQFAQVLAETLAGARSAHQLVPWTTERARDRIQRLGPHLAAGQRPRVRRVVTCHPTADILEMTVVVGFGPRVRALAVRLERAGSSPASPGRDAQQARWLCTTIEAA